jgi:hypothetical protein
MIFTWKIEKFLKNGAFELEKFLNFPSKKFPWEIFLTRDTRTHDTLAPDRILSFLQIRGERPL